MVNILSGEGFKNNMDFLTFGERLGLQRCYEQWLENTSVGDTKLPNNTATFIVFLSTNNLLNINSVREFIEEVI